MPFQSDPHLHGKNVLERLQSAFVHEGKRGELCSFLKFILDRNINSFAFEAVLDLCRLKHSQYKNDATQLKSFLVLKLPPFYLQCVGDVKGGNFKIKKFFN